MQRRLDRRDLVAGMMVSSIPLMLLGVPASVAAHPQQIGKSLGVLIIRHKETPRHSGPVSGPCQFLLSEALGSTKLRHFGPMWLKLERSEKPNKLLLFLNLTKFRHSPTSLRLSQVEEALRTAVKVHRTMNRRRRQRSMVVHPSTLPAVAVGAMPVM